MVIGGCLRLNLGLNSWKSGIWGVKNVFFIRFSMVGIFFFLEIEEKFF